MEKKTIVITGSTRGIGHGLAVQFLQRNHQVVINGRDSEMVAAKVAALQNKGFDVIGVAGDVTHSDTAPALIKAAVSSFKKIDIWINNAGIPQAQKYFYELEDQAIEKVVAVNIVALMLGTKTAIHFFKKQGYGKVFNMEGLGSNGRIIEKQTLYGTTKCAVNYFTKSVSKEVKQKTIQIGTLNPGMVRTDFIQDSMKAGSQEEQKNTKKVVDVLAEDVNVVTKFLVTKMLKSRKQYDRINYLTIWRLIPKLIRLFFVRTA